VPTDGAAVDPVTVRPARIDEREAREALMPSEVEAGRRLPLLRFDPT
jgi:hypothetical protein